MITGGYADGGGILGGGRAIMIGEKLGHYEITAKIGKGGMGVVYRATDTLIGRDVALKTIHLNEIEDPNERQFLKERLFREAKSAGILSHPNIVTVYQIGEQDSLTYIAMEFVDGPNLGEILGRPQRPTLDLLLSVFDQTAAALDYAHSRGVVHRDIKPGNIIVREDGVAKIADFGVAKISSQNVTRAGMALGTPHYMSPEQFHGRAIDGRSDQYSLAVMVYEILTGKKPFTADSIHGLMYKILHEEAQPRRDNPDISEGVDAALRRGLAKDPGNRFPSCADFIGELRTVSGILAVPFSVESGLRQSSSVSSALRHGTTPVPSPVPPLTTRPATPSSGIPAAPSTGAGLPPPPAPPMPLSQATPIPQEMGRSQGFAPGAPAGFPSTPSTGVSLPPKGSAAPPPPGGFSDAHPTPASGVTTPPSSGPASGGMPPPPPKSATGTGAGAAKTKGKDKPKAPAASPSAGAAAAAGKKPSSKAPMVLVGVLGLLFLVIIGAIAVMLMNREPAEDSTQIAVDTPPPVVDTPDSPPPVDPPDTTPDETPVDTPDTPPDTTAATPPPQIASFLAEPATINQGESARLRWSSSNTSYIQINPGLSRGRNEGEHTVTPSETTKYTLIARGLGGRVQREVTVTVVPRQQAQQQQTDPAKPNAWTLDALIRALEAGEDVVKMDNLMVRVGLNGVSFAVTPEAQRAILAAGERGSRPRDSVVRLVDLARQGGRR